MNSDCRFLFGVIIKQNQEKSERIFIDFCNVLIDSAVGGI